MVIIASVAVVMALVAIAAFQIVKNYRNSGYVDVRSSILPRLYLSLAFMFICGLFSDMSDPFMLLADSALAVATAVPLVLSLCPSPRPLLSIWSVPAVVLLMALCHILSSLRVLPSIPSSCYIVFAGLVSASSPCIYVWRIWRKIRDVKSVMKSGNVWSFVTLCVDFVYLIFPVVMFAIFYPVYMCFPETAPAVALVFVVLLFFQLIAIAVRVTYDSAFAILHRHESVIVESMKISQMDMSAVSGSKAGDQYKELYERIVLYFEMSKPYLDGNLTINDVVKVVYSNKVYISKAICHYTGRNFRQFVNYYRVMYSMQLYRANLEMKVNDLAEKSGFNTVVSYTMAFRLFMNETPSEWCRKERSKILKPKK